MTVNATYPDFRILQGDCMERLKEIEDNAIDAIFADPPYFLSNGGISCKNGRVVCVDKGDWDKGGTPEYMYEFNYRWLELCHSKLKDNGTIWVSGTYHNIFIVQRCLKELGYKILNYITWQKSDPAPNISCRYFTFSTELIIWARKLEKKPHKFNYETMKKLNGGTQMTDVWKIPAVGLWEKTCGKHPTQKTLRLLCRIILASTNKEDVILDPFAGSSTTGIAANLLGRKFIGIEKESEFVDLSIRRRQEIENPEIAEKMLRKMSEIPNEATVLVNHAKESTKNLMIEKGICYMRAGESKGSLQITHGFEKMRYVLLHTSGEQIRIFKLKKAGTFQIWTRETLQQYGFNPEHAKYYVVVHFDNTKEMNLSSVINIKQRLNTYRAKIRPLSDFLFG